MINSKRNSFKEINQKQMTITKPVKQLDGSYFSPWIYWISENLMGFFFTSFYHNHIIIYHGDIVQFFVVFLF